MNSMTMTDLVNQALSLVNHNEYITSLDEETTITKMVNVILKQAMNKTFNEVAWSELIVEKESKTSKDELGRRYFILPDDFVMMKECSFDYRIEREKCFTLADVVRYKYISSTVDVRYWSSDLIEAFVHNLAIMMPATILSDANLRMRLQQNYQQVVLKDARYNQASQSTSRIVLQSYYRNGRYNNYPNRLRGKR